jgi:SBF-like CPA transporter family (DUF4137)
MLFEYVGAYFALNVRWSGAKCDLSATGGVKNKNAMRGSNLLGMSAERYYINTSSRLVSAGVRNICDAHALKSRCANLRLGSQRSRSRATNIYGSASGSSSDAIAMSESDEEVVPLIRDSDSSSSKSEEELHHIDAHSSIGSPNMIISELNLRWSMPGASDGSKITQRSPQPPKIITKTQVVVATPPPIVKPNAFKTFIKGNWLVIGEVIVIMLARLNPAFGATGGRLRPEFFVSKLGVFTIFFINGIALSIGKIRKNSLFYFVLFHYNMFCRRRCYK